MVSRDAARGRVALKVSNHDGLPNVGPVGVGQVGHKKWGSRDAAPQSLSPRARSESVDRTRKPPDMTPKKMRKLPRPQAHHQKELARPEKRPEPQKQSREARTSSASSRKARSSSASSRSRKARASSSSSRSRKARNSSSFSRSRSPRAKQKAFLTRTAVSAVFGFSHFRTSRHVSLASFCHLSLSFLCFVFFKNSLNCTIRSFQFFIGIFSILSKHIRCNP